MDERKIIDFIEALKSCKDEKEKESNKCTCHSTEIDLNKILNDPDLFLTDLFKPKDNCECLGCAIFGALSKFLVKSQEDSELIERHNKASNVIKKAMIEKGILFLEMGQVITLKHIADDFNLIAQTYNRIIACINVFEKTKSLVLEERNK